MRIRTLTAALAIVSVLFSSNFVAAETSATTMQALKTEWENTVCPTATDQNQCRLDFSNLALTINQMEFASIKTRLISHRYRSKLHSKDLAAESVFVEMQAATMQLNLLIEKAKEEMDRLAKAYGKK